MEDDGVKAVVWGRRRVRDKAAALIFIVVLDLVGCLVVIYLFFQL